MKNKKIFKKYTNVLNKLVFLQRVTITQKVDKRFTKKIDNKNFQL